MTKDITKILWWHNSHFIKDKDWKKDYPEKIFPEPIGEPFQLENIENIGKNLDEKRINTLKRCLLQSFPQANAYSENTISMDGFYDTIYQAYKI